MEGMTLEQAGSMSLTASSASTQRFLTTVTFQIVFQPEPSLEDRVEEIGAAITDVLVEFLGGKLQRAVRTDDSTIELECEMEVIQKDVPAVDLDLGSKQDPLVQPSPEELLGFASVLQGFRVVLLATNHSQFTQNLTQYLENLGTDLTYVATSDINEITRQLDVFDNRAAIASSGLRGSARDRRMQSVVLVDDDFSLLDSAIQHQLESKAQSVIVCFTSQGHELRAHEFLQGIEVAQAGMAGRVLVVSKPVGPRKLLTALRSMLGNLTLNSDASAQSDDEDEGRRTLARRRTGDKEPSQEPAAAVPAPVEEPAAEKAVRPKTSKKSRGTEVGADGTGSPAPSAPVRPPINVLIAEGGSFGCL